MNQVTINIAHRQHVDIKNWNGDARLYKMEPPYEGYKYVVVSAVNPFFGGGPETYIFGADEAGQCLNWLELKGSFRGGLDHAKALQGAGYVIAAD